jgi:predicted AlkP superfamily phosphohydrolase/phosphomutase/tetratricopeptide (TPR) repeat protein
MPDPPRRKVLLIGWDAADWKVINPLMDAGKMPNIQQLIENGCMAQLATLHPPLSPMLWTSIATGKRPFKHGIHGFAEPAPDGRSVQPVSNLSRTCKAVWNILNQNDLRSVVIGWWPSHPAEPLNGVMVSDHFHRAPGPIRGKSGTLSEKWPPPPGSVHPHELLGTLAELRFHPDELHPEMVEPFVPKAAEIDQDKDRRLAGLMKTLCECVTMHSAATWLLDNQAWDFFTVYFDAIDHFCHGFMRYHAPRQEWISERDFELYSGVVNRAYQLHDQMLGTLLEKAGPDTTVILISDHGFHPDHLRPRQIPDIPAGPAIEHRDFGIFVMAGPGIKKDELLYGANVLDIAPTLLTLYGLPVGEDMDGKVLSAAFEQPPVLKPIPSWEDVPGNAGRHPAHTLLDPIAAREALQQMVALGYIAEPGENSEKAVAQTVRELRYNLGEAYQNDDRHQEATEIFRDLYDREPDEQRFAVRYFVSCQALSLVSEMRRIVDDLDGRRRLLYEEAAQKTSEFRRMAKERLALRKNGPVDQTGDDDHPDPDQKIEPLLSREEWLEFARWRDLTRYQPAVVDYLKGQILTAEKRYAEALECLNRITGEHLTRPGLLLQTGDLYRKLRRFREARETYKRALIIDPDNPHAHLGMCRMALLSRSYERAAEHALNCLQRLYHFPMAHYFLGQSLAGMEDYPRAAAAYRLAVSQNPHFPAAHLRLATLLEEKLGDPEGAGEHRRQVRKMRRTVRGTAQAPPRHSAVQDSANWMERPGTTPLRESLVVVTGLPRSGTSMLMQMLAAGDVTPVTDGVRQSDEDNPRGYFEFEPVKKLLENAEWLDSARGKAVKIVVPLLPAIPSGLPLRVIVIERDLNEILDSQAKMIQRRGETIPDTPARRERLKAEYKRTLQKTKVWLGRRPQTGVLVLTRAAILAHPLAEAKRIREFLSGEPDASRMAAAVDPSLHRQRRV